MTKEINRRGFLKASVIGAGGLVLAGCKVTQQDLKRISSDYQRKLGMKLYELGQSLQKATTTTTAELAPYGISTRRATGNGVVLCDRQIYQSVAHITNPRVIKQRTPFGTIDYPLRIIEERTEIDGVELEPIYESRQGERGQGDVAIFKIPSKLRDKVKDFKVTPSQRSDLRIGDPLWIIGDPGLTGANIRKDYVSDLDGFEGGIEPVEQYFGFGKSGYPGDSGTAIVDQDAKKLLGLIHGGIPGAVGWAVRQEPCFNKHIEKYL